MTMISRSVLLTLASFALLITSSDIHSEEWSQFRGLDYGRTGETLVAERWTSDNIQWKTALPGRGASSPVIYQDRIYLTAYTGYGIDKNEPGSEKDLKRHLFCIGAADGRMIWQKETPTTSDSNPFTVWAVSLHGYASSTPAVDESGIYVFYGATGVLAFTHDGDERWRTNCGTGTHPFGAGNSPITHGDLVIINASVESGKLVALHKSDGSVAWEQGEIEQSWNTPVIYRGLGDSLELALTVKGKIRAFHPNTGKPLWYCDGIDDYICPSIIVRDGILYALGGRSSRAIAIRSGGIGDVTETHTVWNIGKGSNVSSPVYHDGHLYWAKEKSGILYCVNATTGDVVYEERLAPSPGLIYASPLLANERLYYISRENGIYVVAAQPEFKLLSHDTLDGDDSIFNASPVPLPGGSVLVRSDKYLYRFTPAG
jgi:outer membrane protein assembly factor BamB